MTTRELSREEIAEKAAGMLGWEWQEATYSNDNWGHLVTSSGWKRNGEYLTLPGKTQKIISLEYLVEVIFSWPTFGLCIEKAREGGWRVGTNGYTWGFHNGEIKDEANRRTTNFYFVSDYGDIEAIIRAYAETSK